MINKMDEIDAQLLDFSLSINEVSKSLGYSGSRAFSRDLGHPPVERRNSLKLMVVDSLLSYDGLKVKVADVANAVNLEHAGFSMFIKRVTGKTSKERREFLLENKDVIDYGIEISDATQELIDNVVKIAVAKAIEKAVEKQAKSDELVKPLSPKEEAALKNVEANKFVREFIEAYESNGSSIDPNSENSAMKALMHECAPQIMHRAGLTPDEFYERVMGVVKPKVMLVQNFTSAALSCPSDKTVQEIIDITRKVLADDISVNNDGVWDEISKEIEGDKIDLMALFLNKTNVLHHSFISRIRFEEAARIVAKEEKTINTTYCEGLVKEVGLGSAYMTIRDLFEKITGMPPIEFQEDMHSKAKHMLDGYAKSYAAAINEGDDTEDAFADIRSAVNDNAELILEETCLDADNFLERFKERIGYVPEYKEEYIV